MSANSGLREPKYHPDTVRLIVASQLNSLTGSDPVDDHLYAELLILRLLKAIGEVDAVDCYLRAKERCGFEYGD